jgi:hypothetical protein
MKHYLIEVLICTIFAAIVSLLLFLLGLDKTWQDASTTFGTTFLIMCVLGVYVRMKNSPN